MGEFKIKELLEEADQLQSDQDKSHAGIFSIKTANQCLEDAKKRPIPRMLFDEFWFEGEVCILFSDTNLGKSILGVQIADSISKGQQIPGFKLDAEVQKVTLFDFELSDKQFENRYSRNYDNHYEFDEKFYRLEIDPDTDIPEGNDEDIINDSIEKAIVSTGSKIVIVDNLTYLKNETEKARSALPLMKHLKGLKRKYGLSILALAHTPKRDPHSALTNNDLQGSKMLINFCDSAFTIGQSYKSEGLKYLKQIKVRNAQHQYTTNNVIVCKITKPDNIVKFEFQDYGDEIDHLKQRSREDRERHIAEATSLKRSGQTNVAIASKFGVSEKTIRDWTREPF